MKHKITIRISDSLRTKLSEKSETEKVSVSEVARTILENYFSTNTSPEGQLFIKEPEQTIQKIDLINEIDNKPEKDIAFSREFYQLLIWMYDQKDSRELKLSKVELDSFKNTINKIQFSSFLPNELKKEFDKVYVDLVGMINSAYKWKSTPDFAYGLRLGGFNYKMLNQFLFPEIITIELLTSRDNSYD